MKLSNLLATLALAAATPAGAQVCPYENLLPEFAQFVAATGDLAPPARAEAFVDRFAAKHPDFYSESMFGNRAKQVRLAQRLFDPEQASKFPGARPVRLDDVLATGRTITTDYARIEGTFRKAFPDYSCKMPISFGLSLFMFDGNQDQATKSPMRFGVDMITLLHPPEQLPPFFHHELFHIYLQQAVDADALGAEQPVWWALWDEGLATYVSWKLNPTLSAEQIFWIPRDMETQMQPKLAEAARLILPDLDGSQNYSRWFNLGAKLPPGLPPRSGYYLGYLLARSLDRGDLVALARTPPEQVHREARKYFEALAAGK